MTPRPLTAEEALQQIIDKMQAAAYHRNYRQACIDANEIALSWKDAITRASRRGSDQATTRIYISPEDWREISDFCASQPHYSHLAAARPQHGTRLFGWLVGVGDDLRGDETRTVACGWQRGVLVGHFWAQ